MSVRIITHISGLVTTRHLEQRRLLAVAGVDIISRLDSSLDIAPFLSADSPYRDISLKISSIAQCLVMGILR